MELGARKNGNRLGNSLQSGAQQRAGVIIRTVAITIMEALVSSTIRPVETEIRPEREVRAVPPQPTPWGSGNISR